jgi:hypothetical protein
MNTNMTSSETAERILCALFKEVLGLDYVNLDDGFFRLAGDSISVLRLVAAAREAGLNLSVQDVFENNSIRALAKQAAAAGLEDAEAPAHTDQHDHEAGGLFLELNPGELEEFERDARRGP